MQKIDGGDIVVLLLIFFMCVIIGIAGFQGYAKYKCGQLGYSESEVLWSDVYCIQTVETERTLLINIIGGE